MSEDNDIAIALLRKDVDALNTKVENLSNQIKELLEAWNTATGVVKFVKWLSSIAGAILVIVGFFKGWFK